MSKRKILFMIVVIAVFIIGSIAAIHYSSIDSDDSKETPDERDSPLDDPEIPHFSPSIITCKGEVCAS